MTNRPDRSDRPTPPPAPSATPRVPERDRPDDVRPGTDESQQPADGGVDPLFKEGAGAPDAADIEDPETQR